MPLIKVDTINTTSQWALWHITESTADLLEISAAPDVQVFNKENIKHPLKQKEWLAARLVLKFLTDRMGEKYNGSQKNEYGKPFLANNAMYVSITNSFPYAAGIVCSKAPVGIDLEYPKEKLRVLAPKFLNNEELNIVNGDLFKLCIYWCAKETLFKIYGRNKISLKENIFVAPFDLSQTSTIRGTISTENNILKYDICYNAFDRFIVCFNIN